MLYLSGAVDGEWPRGYAMQVPACNAVSSLAIRCWRIMCMRRCRSELSTGKSPTNESPDRDLASDERTSESHGPLTGKDRDDRVSK
jgi:hypothetical protein